MNAPLQLSSRSATLDVPALTAAQRAAVEALRRVLQGEVLDDDVSRVLFATDASIYEVIPVAVVRPRSTADVVATVRIAAAHGIPLTARTAGTSLAGQAVGPGFVVDLGRHLTQVLTVDAPRREVRVQPGVIRDELNRGLRSEALLFGPDTSTSNRAMIGGMIGNNSCGSFSIYYGTTRDNVESLQILLTDGTLAEVGRCDRATWEGYLARADRLGDGVRVLDRLVRAHAQTIRARFPKPEVLRRNTGYALDDLADSWLGHNPDRDPDLARFFCGTEGTLALATEATLRLWPTPGASVLVAGHFDTLDASMHATVEAVAHQPAAVELMDKRILDLAALNPAQNRNRWFLQGDPAALLVVEFFGDTLDDATAKAHGLIERWQSLGMGYAWPIIAPPKIASVWELRKAGLGVLFGSPGDVKPVTLVEDTAVAVADLPAFVQDFAAIMGRWSANCVYYAHASVGELHLRPELDFKKADDIRRAEGIAQDVAELVARYRGSLSGEHGDGRLRSPYLRTALGDDVVGWFSEIKAAFDPDGLLNPGNIVDPAPMTADWRYHAHYQQQEPETLFQYATSGGFQRAVERCNGSGDCRRLATAGGTMCPSYMVTHEERDTTRGRANLFRRLIQKGPDALFGSAELKDALDLCISCKGCKNDCPASVDMATLKAEFQQGWMDRHGVPLSAWAFARATELGGFAQAIPGGAAVANALQQFGPTRALMARALGIGRARTFPAWAPRSFRQQARRRSLPSEGRHGRVALFVDEFTDRQEPDLAWAAVALLQAGGWGVVLPPTGPSGRAYLSKGFVRDARAMIEANIRTLHAVLSDVEAIVGIEPSAILTYVDEALDLPRDPALVEMARAVAAKVQLVEQFVVEQTDQGRFDATFRPTPVQIHLHGHCHQKALSTVAPTQRALQLIPGATVIVIPSGCCGMAGSFGYEAQHVEVSMAIGELVLFPAVRRTTADAVIVAPGTSCRHQIHDGTGRTALHPVTVLRGALG